MRLNAIAVLLLALFVNAPAVHAGVCAGTFSDSTEAANSLTDTDKKAISSYTDFDSFYINAVLRGNSRIPLLGESTPELRRTAGLIDNLDGTKTDLAQQTWDSHVPGAIVSYPAFTSASEPSFDGGSFADDITLAIHSKHGKSVADYSKNGFEKEVLFVPGTRFTVVKRDKSSDGKISIELEEAE